MKARRPPAVRHVRRRLDLPVPAAPSSRFDTFRNWHREPSFYREVYARATSAVIAAAAIYVFGAAIGVFSRKPLAYISAGLVILSTAWMVYVLVQVRKSKKIEASSSASREEVLDEARKFSRLLVVNTVLVGIFVVTITIFGY